METSRAVPAGAIDASDLASIIREPGPFLSAHLSTEGAIEKAAQRDVAEWRRFRDRLPEVPAAALARSYWGKGSTVRYFSMIFCRSSRGARLTLGNWSFDWKGRHA